jgi:ferredoxin
MMNVQEALEAWKKGCFEQRLAIEVRGHHCATCARTLLDGLRRLLALRKREAPSLWLEACAHGAQDPAQCARCTAQVVKEVARIRAPSLSVQIEFPHERLGWKPS